MTPVFISSSCSACSFEASFCAAAAARAAIERSLGQSVDEVFGSFESTPLAAASIAQVHAATLKDGREVIVKVLRPGMHAQIRRDLEVLYAFARLALAYVPAELAQRNDGFDIEAMGAPRRATVASEAPFDPSGSRMRG